MHTLRAVKSGTIARRATYLIIHFVVHSAHGRFEARKTQSLKTVLHKTWDSERDNKQEGPRELRSVILALLPCVGRLRLLVKWRTNGRKIEARQDKQHDENDENNFYIKHCLRSVAKEGHRPLCFVFR